MTTNIYTANINGDESSFVSILPTDEVFAKGLTESAILGRIINPQEPLSAANIKVNPVFVSLVHKVIEVTSIELKECQEAARLQGQGFLYITDARDRFYPNTKPADIIGAFAVENGELQEKSYQPNPSYQLISEDGLFQLPEAYIESLMVEMRK